MPKLEFEAINALKIVYKKSYPADFLYFIIKGRVNYILDTESAVFKSVVEGSYFGEI